MSKLVAENPLVHLHPFGKPRHISNEIIGRLTLHLWEFRDAGTRDFAEKSRLAVTIPNRSRHTDSYHSTCENHSAPGLGLAGELNATLPQRHLR